MPQVVLSVFTSLDGFYAGPNGEFIPPEWSDDMEAWAGAAMAQSSHFIYGRVNFAFNKAFWSEAETNPDSPAAEHAYAKEMNAKPKTVFSRTLTGDPGWNAVVSDDPAARVAELKASVDKDIFIFGSGNLVKSFVALDLIDEYRILLTPSVQGSGMRLFGDSAPNLPLTLVEARGLDTGAVLLRHRRKREV
ncbi:MAG: dihydrofolate reductase family protein [Phreatobacter sp.]|uniref:dihydrofolate reductase family protein n=1 Tax=Phreatobacter sp. TaxID=1966341 RepID=UPI001A58F9D1|nr:dihydrofolate reductase family protein [Phreatobacter sp.]MBL8570156.1 dihydrofolate reductase family protein [Phreatobacter sp.]